MKKMTIGIGVIGALVLCYFLASPYITVYHMKKAVENHDGEALSEYIDFLRLRQSLKDQINIIVGKRIATGALNDNVFAYISAALGTTLIEKIVDTYVTPAALMNIMKGERLENSKPSQGSAKIHDFREPLAEASLSYESFNKFSITIPDEREDRRFRFILRRRGFSWKLTEVVFPAALMSGLIKTASDKIDNDPGVKRLSFKDVTGAFINTKSSGQIFVVKGKVVNNYSHSRSLILLKCNLLNDQGDVVKSKQVYAGYSLSENKLRKVPFQEIEKRMKNRRRIKENVNVAPGASIGFMIVFQKLPSNVSEFTVEAVRSLPGD